MGGTQAKLSHISEAAKKLDWDEYSRDLRDLWKTYDKDHNGFLDRKEACQFIEDMLHMTARRLGKNVNLLLEEWFNHTEMKKAVSELYEMMDSDLNGKIDFEEFQKQVRDLVEGHPAAPVTVTAVRLLGSERKTLTNVVAGAIAKEVHKEIQSVVHDLVPVVYQEVKAQIIEDMKPTFKEHIEPELAKAKEVLNKGHEILQKIEPYTHFLVPALIAFVALPYLVMLKYLLFG